ncbi:MAG: hypothetical protein ACD_17C00276G0002 [uncultured bacterium]|nr:MAG: hypothetical protein ACD_17C00276G0002 [uncultured bacterium]
MSVSSTSYQLIQPHTYDCPTQICSQCEKYNQSLLRCKQCLSTLYCGKQHQRQHWPTHKPVCQLSSKEAYRNFWERWDQLAKTCNIEQYTPDRALYEVNQRSRETIVQWIELYKNGLPEVVKDSGRYALQRASQTPFLPTKEPSLLVAPPMGVDIFYDLIPQLLGGLKNKRQIKIYVPRFTDTNPMYNLVAQAIDSIRRVDQDLGAKVTEYANQNITYLSKEEELEQIPGSFSLISFIEALEFLDHDRMAKVLGVTLPRLTEDGKVVVAARSVEQVGRYEAYIADAKQHRYRPLFHSYQQVHRIFLTLGFACFHHLPNERETRNYLTMCIAVLERTFEKNDAKFSSGMQHVFGETPRQEQKQ